MKVVIFAGGYGTRLSEETGLRPKPMVELGGKPILWHIMKLYSQQGFNEFVILLGYKGHVIKEFFLDYFKLQSDFRIDLENDNMEILKNNSEPWKVTLLDTGLNTMTGGRLKRASEFLKDEPFMLTYGDGLSDIDLRKLLNAHKNNHGLITMTSIQPKGRFGTMVSDSEDRVISFKEKPQDSGEWINGGFFICEPGVLDYIEGDSTVFEQRPLEALAANNELYTYHHHGFWQCMDTIRDKRYLEDMWKNNAAPWKLWT